jgi:hypothetical protein
MAAFAGLVGKDLGGWRWPELHVFGDASGESKWAGTGESCWDIVRECLKGMGVTYRLKVPAANPPIADRVNAVNCACRDFGGRVHYKAHPDCGPLIEDYRRMKWDAKGEVDKSNRKRSHPSDAEGYRIHYLRPVRKPQPARGAVGMVKVA